MKNILVTSSSGLTGQSVVRHLAQSNIRIKAMVHSEKNAAKMLATGATETVTASIENADDMRRAMDGIDTVFYICPTAHRDEASIGIMAIDIAKENGVRRFIYQSVHNSIEPDLIHHREKLLIEQHLLESGLRYSILRPAAFMQNLLPNINGIKDNRRFAQRFYTNADATNRINLIDAEDYGEIGAKVALDDVYDYAQLDLCGPQNLSAAEMLMTLNEVTGNEIALEYISDDEFVRMASSRNMPPHTINVLLTMFRSYNRYGFLGNPFVSSSVLGRKLKDFKTFVSNALSIESVL